MDTGIQNNNNDDYAIENLSDDESESDGDTSDEDGQDDEKQQQQGQKIRVNDIDYNVVCEQLNLMKFGGKKHLPFIQKSFHFHAYGFKNKNHCKILFKATKKLIQK